jgi:hypothetical protein
MGLHRAVKALINVVIDSGIGMHRRIEAAETIMQFPVPQPVIDATRRFLLEVAESQASTPGLRVAAAKAVLRRDMPRLKRMPIEPNKWDPLRQMSRLTATELIEDGLRRTAERDAKLRLVASTEPADVEPEPKAG